MAVGFALPNNRSEVSTLIDDIFKAFGLSIAIADFPTIVAMALQCVRSGRRADTAFLRKRGIVELQTP
jgi:hypothetical protein